MSSKLTQLAREPLVQFFLMGLVAEMIVRTYHESQGKTTYVVRRTLPAGEKFNK